MNPPITVNLTLLYYQQKEMDLLRTQEKKLIKHMIKLVSSLILFPPLNSFPPFRSREKLISAETIQGNTVATDFYTKILI